MAVRLRLSEPEARLLVAVLGCCAKELREGSNRRLTRVAELFGSAELIRIADRLEMAFLPQVSGLQFVARQVKEKADGC